jgi:hypothetical protein
MASDLAVGARPLDLVPGNPDELDRLAARLSTFAIGMADAAYELGSIRAGEWRGPAGDAFRTLISDQPRNYDDAADAFSRAAAALSRYAHAVREAQADAGIAISLHEQAHRDTEAWKEEWDRHHAEVEAATASGTAPSSPRPADADPGAGDRARAQRRLEDARLVVDSQGRTAASALLDAGEAAPKKPGLLDSIIGGAGDAWSAFTGVLEDAGDWVVDTLDDVSAWLAGVGPSLLEIVGGVGLIIVGGAIMVAAGGMEVVGVGLDATGVGALGGVPLNLAGVAVFTGGLAVAGGGAALLGHGIGGLITAMAWKTENAR